jgi:Zn-dependent protease
VLYVLFLIMCVAVHEFGHAYMADRLGDPLPRQQGRVTLNPLAHIDLLGTVIFPLIGFVSGAPILGWGKPVEWSGHPRFLTRRFSMRTIHLLVSVAGPAMNLLLAVVLSAVYILVSRVGGPDAARGPAAILLYLARMNLGLMFFNLLPIPPLDGRSFLYFLPRPLSPLRDTLFRYGAFIFMALILIPPIAGGMRPLDIIMWPCYQVIAWFLSLVQGLAL